MNWLVVLICLFQHAEKCLMNGWTLRMNIYIFLSLGLKEKQSNAICLKVSKDNIQTGLKPHNRLCNLCFSPLTSLMFSSYTSTSSSKWFKFVYCSCIVSMSVLISFWDWFICSHYSFRSSTTLLYFSCNLFCLLFPFLVLYVESLFFASSSLIVDSRSGFDNFIFTFPNCSFLFNFLFFISGQIWNSCSML